MFRWQSAPSVDSSELLAIGEVGDRSRVGIEDGGEICGGRGGASV